MADATHGSTYDKYWLLIREHRWKQKDPKNPNAIIELEAPPEQHRKIIKAIRNRKWLDQLHTGRNYGILFAKSVGSAIRFKLIPPQIGKI